MAESEPRYEFRVWGENLDLHRAQLERRATPVQAASSEIYFVPRTTERCNAKIRDDLMDIKVLVREHRGLEQWKPTLKTPFPLDRSVISAQIFPDLESQPPQLSRPHYELGEFLKEVVETDDRIAIVRLSKTRLKFSLGKCQAEFTEVHFNNVTSCRTVAVESTYPEELLHTLGEIGLDGAENVSYIRYLRRTLNLEGPSRIL
jgi:hypothetical protein